LPGNRAHHNDLLINRQLRELQDENARLKRMYADLGLTHSALKDVVERKL
jgi:hypothetical protein